MENLEKRVRGPDWSHAQTMALAELKREASLIKKYGPPVWDEIAETLARRFPDPIRTGAQCRRRWDTLVKVYTHIESYCGQTGAEDHRELDEGELASMKLATTYHPDWYDIVEQVYSPRDAKERCDRDLMLAKRIKGSHSFELPEHSPNRDSLCSASTSKSVTYYEHSTPESTSAYAQVSDSSPSLEADELSPEEEVLRHGNDGLMLEQSTSAYAQVASSPSLEDDKLGPEEEIPRLMNENDGLVLSKVTGQHGKASHEVSQVYQTSDSTENGAHPEDEAFWAFLYATFAFETSAEVQQREMESVGLGAQPNEPLQDNVRNNSIEPALRGGALHLPRTDSSQSAESTISSQSRRWSVKKLFEKNVAKLVAKLRDL